jgi:hypothetical protein
MVQSLAIARNHAGRLERGRDFKWGTQLISMTVDHLTKQQGVPPHDLTVEIICDTIRFVKN